MNGFVNVTEFMDYLRSNDLVITRRDAVLSDEQIKAEMQRVKIKKLLSKKWLTLREITDNNLLDVGSRSGLLYALRDHDYAIKQIQGKTRVLTSVIKQLRDERAIV